MDRAKTDHFLVETESAFQGRGVVATPARAVGEHPPTILMSRDSFALDTLCQVDLALALPRERISKAITTPPIRLCVRAKRGMCDGSGNQNLTTRVAIEDTSMPTPLYHKNLWRILTNSVVCTRVPHRLVLVSLCEVGPLDSLGWQLWKVNSPAARTPSRADPTPRKIRRHQRSG